MSFHVAGIQIHSLVFRILLEDGRSDDKVVMLHKQSPKEEDLGIYTAVEPLSSGMTGYFHLPLGPSFHHSEIYLMAARGRIE